MLSLLLTSSLLSVAWSVPLPSPSRCGTCKVCFNPASSKCQDQGPHRPKTKAACEAKGHIWCGDSPTPSPPSPPPSPPSPPSPPPSPSPSPPSPGDFDVRTKWPQCAQEVLNQGNCGSCWAFGSSEAISDRFCIKGEKVQLSPQSLVSCSGTVHQGGGGTCIGGSPGNALKYMASHGLQSCANECTSGCEPYGSGQIPSGCKTDPNNDNCHGCDKQCHDGTKATFYKVDASSIVHGKLDSEEEKIMAEIEAHGSVTGGLKVYGNWGNWVKTHGPNAVYDSHEGSKKLGGHVIKIIGFGVSEGKKYWLVQNSWGPGFGDHGTIKMLRGGGVAKDIMNDESFYATPVLKSTSDFKNTSLAELEIDLSFPAADDVVTGGGWSDGDPKHPEWHSLARQVLASSNVAGEFDNLERVESQVVAGFNARFTIVTKEGTRAVIWCAFGPEDELKTGPLVESVVEFKSVVV